MASAWEKAKLQTEAERISSRAYEFRGDNLAIQEMTDPEVLLCGPAGSGKTLAILHKINRRMWEYPGARTLIVRKVRADLAQSILVTYERDVLGLDNPICAGVLRENRLSYRYPNGSEVVVGGMDRPGKILSSEYDLIYPAEAVQFEQNDWETFLMRNRNFVIPYQQILADTNPGHPQHFLKQMADAGAIRFLNSFHKDNPAYWDVEKEDWTPRGRMYVQGTLGRLTGVRRARFLENKWVIAEGAVYEEFSDAIHVIDRFEIPREWKRYRAADFGFSNPFVMQWWAMDADGRLYLYREIYMTQRTVAQHAKQIKELTGDERIEFTVTDHDAEDRATLHQNGIKTVAAEKAISVGIQEVKERLAVAGDGKPRIFFLRNSLVELDENLVDSDSPERHTSPVSTLEEFPAYVWPKGEDGKTKKEKPVDADNHGMDTMRYMVMAVRTRKPARGHKRNPIFRT
jgi:PBSX family phage terminase large subunit